MKYNHQFPVNPTDAADGELISTFPLLTYNHLGFDALYVGGAAAVDVAIKSKDGESATFQDVQPGTVLEVAGHQVLDTGTTAVDMVGLRERPRFSPVRST